MARFEAALAQASADCGIVPSAHAQAIAQVCAKASFDAKALASSARQAGTLAIPFVKALTQKVAAVSPDAANNVLIQAKEQGVPAFVIGKCGGDSLVSAGQFSVPVARLRAAHESSLPGYMSGNSR